YAALLKETKPGKTKPLISVTTLNSACTYLVQSGNL
ncbi:MAG: hypothetical protein ACI96M_003976, partial [Candidatus Azotimanducaceae bacterium]